MSVKVLKRISTILFVFACTQVVRVQAQDLEHINLKRPVTFHGSLNLQLEYYHVQGITPRQKKFSFLLNGSPVVNVLGVAIPLSFVVSSFENKFYQPFNQFGLSPRYKWATLHLGYRNITYSNYTLAGHRMLGAGFELKPKNFRIGFMYGQLKRATSLNPHTPDINQLYLNPAPTLTRMGMAGELGYGNDKSFIDLIYFKGWDKPASLSDQQKNPVQPAENTTIGLNTKVTFLQKLSWAADIGLSAYTLNRMDDKGNTQAGLIKDIMNLLAPAKASTRYYFAGETRIGYQENIWGAQLIYKRIDPGYQSMGAYFFQNDIQEMSLANNFKLDSGKLHINTSIGFQTDNLNKQKTSTGKRFIGSANVNFIPSQKFGVNFNFTNSGITNNPLQTSPGNELFKQVNNSFMLMPFFTWMNEQSVRNLNLVASYQSLSTPHSYLGSTPDLNTYSLTGVYNYTWIKKGINANITANYINSKTPQGDVGSFGGALGGMAPVLEKKANINASLSFLENTFKGVDNGHTIRAMAGISVPVGTHHNFQLLGNYTSNAAKDISIIENFNELSIQFIYGLNF